jgi:hypothetical protein
VRLDLFHAGVLDVNLFSQKLDLLLEPVLFGLLSELGIHALGCPTPSQRQRGPGKGDDVDDRRADTSRPASGRGRKCAGRGMTSLPKESRDERLADSLTY